MDARGTPDTAPAGGVVLSRMSIILSIPGDDLRRNVAATDSGKDLRKVRLDFQGISLSSPVSAILSRRGFLVSFRASVWRRDFSLRDSVKPLSPVTEGGRERRSLS